jgi:uncharacterized membrane protein YoaK (UPF0700 family)
MRKGVITVLAAVAIVIAAIQWTPLAFLSKDSTDFVCGLAGGLSIGAIVAWFAGPSR